MNIFKVSRFKMAAYFAGAATVVAVAYRLSNTGRDQLDSLVDKFYDRSNISVETTTAEEMGSEVVSSWAVSDDEDDDGDDFQED